MNVNANIFLSSDTYKQIDNMKNNSIELFKYIVEVSTISQKYADLFYKAFCDLLESDVLNNDEKRIVEIILDYYSNSNGMLPSLNYLKDKYYKPLYNDKYEDIKFKTFKNNPNTVPIIVEEFISCRNTDTFIDKNKEIIRDMANAQTLPTGFLYKVEDFRNTNIPFNLNTTNLVHNKMNDRLNVGIDFIDDNCKSLEVGSFNCLIKNKIADNFLEVAILYNAVINEQKNVCYITTEWSSKNIIDKLISIHSNTLDEQFKIDYLDLKKGNIKPEIIDKVLEDFKEKANSHIQIFNSNSLNVFNTDTFRKLIFGVDYKFHSLTNKKTELLIVDTLENLRLENTGIIEDSKSKIVKVYSNFFLRQSKLSFNKTSSALTVLVSTNSCCKSTYEYFLKPFDMTCYIKDIEITNSVLEKYADNVFAFILDSKNKKDKHLDGIFQITKNRNNELLDEVIYPTVSLTDCKIHESNQKKEEPQTLNNINTTENKIPKETLEDFVKTLKN